MIIANLLKYPFFEFGSRYANATGKSIIDGYKEIGNWALWCYTLITLGSMFFVCAAVGKVTTGFLQNLFQLDSMGINSTTANILVFGVCGSLLIIGRFKILDGLIKIIGIVLLISTLAAFILCIFNGPVNQSVSYEFFSMESSAIAFLIPLMGWMPTAVDLSSWNSLWTIEKIKLSGYHPKLKETLFDFNFGYITSAFLSICFVTLGAFLIYGTDTEIAKQGHLFAHQVIQLYTQVFGSWSYIIISSCTFSIMFGTCIAVFDGYARATKRIIKLFGERNESKTSKKSYPIAVITLIVGSFILIEIFSSRGDFSILVNLATIISFLVAPVIAIFNHYLVTKKIDEDFKPSLWLKTLSYMGIFYLIGFSVFFLIYTFIQ
ncbi:MAG: divalent metal cation transporter [Bacteroidota bacterium]|nr:divalent metal cation transporter [Bacteroidota bacterium]